MKFDDSMMTVTNPPEVSNPEMAQDGTIIDPDGMEQQTKFIPENTSSGQVPTNFSSTNIEPRIANVANNMPVEKVSFNSVNEKLLYDIFHVTTVKKLFNINPANGLTCNVYLLA